MKRYACLFLTAFVLCCFGQSALAAADWGEIREATLNLNVREQRSAGSVHVVTLKKGQKVKVDFEENGWVAVFNVNEVKRDESRAIGYANLSFLSPVEGKAAAPSDTAKKDVAEPTGTMKSDVEAALPVPQSDVGSDPNRTPVEITSDRMVYDEQKKIVSFVGNVVAVHGELTLKSDSLSAHLVASSRKGFSADSIDRIVALGNVRATKGKSKGTCGKLTYMVKNQILRMEENPVLQDGPNSLAGEIINYYVRENRSEVVSGQGQRVKAVFMTPENVKVP